MSTYDTFYSKLGGWAVDGPILHEPYNYIPTVYVDEPYEQSSRHCIWTGNVVSNRCVRVLGITARDSASVSLSVRGTSALQSAVEDEDDIAAACPSEGVYTRTMREKTTGEVGTYCPICTEGIGAGDQAVVFSENPLRDKLLQQSTVWLHQGCLPQFNNVIEGFWNYTGEALGDAL